MMNYKKIAGGAALAILIIFVSNLFLTLTYYNPRVALAAYHYLARPPLGKIIFKNESAPTFDELYPLVQIANLQRDRFWGPRAQVAGIVTEVEKIMDGDWHVNVRDATGRTLVAEIVSQFPLTPPAVGENIAIWGITRFDLEHRWWELHPVFGWQAR